MVPEEIIINLHEVPGFGLRKVKAIIERFPDIASWNDLLCQDFTRIEGISRTLVERLKAADPDQGIRILERIHDMDSRYIHYWHEDYPPLLKELYDAPVGLYMRGAGQITADSIAVVGTRRPTDYGRLQARELSQALTAAGLNIVSGFARGIDTIAHKAALENNSCTIAVLGCGVDVIYPIENKRFYRDLLERGVAVSEYQPGTKPEGHHFPQRNRIISGLALGTLVVEAGRGSGALITSIHALNNGREVFAVPGRIDSPKSSGCHQLINEGAKLVERVEDILAELPAPYSATPGQQLDFLGDLPQPEREILEYLDGDPVIVDKIAEDLNRDISDMLVTLTYLEMKGLVRQAAGKRYARA